MKHTNANSLASQFAAWRSRQKAASLGAVALLSLANLRSAEREESADASRRIAETVTARGTDDNTEDEDTRGAVSRFAAYDETAPHSATVGAYLLTPGERAALHAARPAARSVIFRMTSPASVPALDPLPPDFTPAAVADFTPAGEELSAEELAAINAESAEEIAAIDAAAAAAARIAYACAFRSDFGPQFAPVDYSPDAGRKACPAPVASPRALPAPVAVAVTVAPTPAPAAAVAGMDFEALRLAVLAGGKRRK